jgi:hypothetical protein
MDSSTESEEWRIARTSAYLDGPRWPHRTPCPGAAPRACYPMNSLPPPFVFFVLLVSGWVNRQQQAVIDYLLEENRVLRAAHGP